SITRNFEGPVTITPGASPAGVQVNPKAGITLAAGQTQAAFDLYVLAPQPGDLGQVFTATATVDGVIVTARYNFVIHVVATTTTSDRYSVTIQKDPSAGNDASTVDAILGVSLVRQITLIKEIAGTSRKITVNGIVVCGVAVVLSNTGDKSFDPEGNFAAIGVATIQMGARGAQPIQVDILGRTNSAGDMILAITVRPQSTASYQFGPTRYVGEG